MKGHCLNRRVIQELMLLLHCREIPVTPTDTALTGCLTEAQRHAYQNTQPRQEIFKVVQAFSSSQKAQKRDLKQDSPFCLDSLLSATFLSAEAMASEGMRGLSTYLGFLLGPVSMNQRYREREGEINVI